MGGHVEVIAEPLTPAAEAIIDKAFFWPSANTSSGRPA